MPGTPWLSVNGMDYFHDLKSSGISVEDREGDLYPQIRSLRDDSPELCSLSYYTLSDLELPHGSATPDIFDAAIENGAKIVPYGIALRTLVEYPGAFKNNWLRRLFSKTVPFESCLIGVKPLISNRGRKYVVELAPNHFRFRLADEDERWGDYEYWVFAT
jgi:hypothetical protein